MSKQIKAMKLARKALKDCHYYMINAGLPNQSLLNEVFAAHKALGKALAEQPAQQEIDELTAQRDKLADLLTRTANALKGQPAELSRHSWHDLPDVAQQLKAQAQQEPVAWNVIDPLGKVVATETNAVRGWARIAGYKPTVEGLLGFHEQGWRIVPTSPQLPAQPLTDEQIMAIGKELGVKCRLGGNPNIDFEYARAIEAAHGINTKGNT